MRRLLYGLSAAAVAAILVVGLMQASGDGQADDGPRFVLEPALERLRGAPAPLAALHAQANALLDGGYEARLEALEGTPVVVNKWASWCGPCRAEFPIFQRVSTDLGRKVAFLGLNSGDNRDDAADFLARYPVPFPSYVDPSGRLSRASGAGENFPTTVFYDRTGRRAFVHQGQYRTAADLLGDIERYAR